MDTTAWLNMFKASATTSDGNYEHKETLPPLGRIALGLFDSVVGSERDVGRQRAESNEIEDGIHDMKRAGLLAVWKI